MMENTFFSTIFAGEGLFTPNYSRGVDDAIFGQISSACALADDAILLFVGVYPFTDYLDIAEPMKALPWATEYLLQKSNPSPEFISKTKEAIRKMAFDLLKTDTYSNRVRGKLIFPNLGGQSGSSEADIKGQTQSLAVQTILCADMALADALESEFLSASDHLIDAHKNLFIANMKCQRLVEQGSNAANIGRLGGQKRAELDPRSRDKAAARSKWGVWQDNPEQYKNKEAFARAMADSAKYSVGSTDVIKRWVRQWESEAENGKQKPKIGDFSA